MYAAGRAQARQNHGIRQASPPKTTRRIAMTCTGRKMRPRTPRGHQKDQEDEPERSDRRVSARDAPAEDRDEHARSVQRRDRDQVEDPEQDVDQREVEQDVGRAGRGPGRELVPRSATKSSGIASGVRALIPRERRGRAMARRKLETGPAAETTRLASRGLRVWTGSRASASRRRRSRPSGERCTS